MALLGAFLCPAAVLAVEGAGSYRASGFVLPHFRNTSRTVTFVRIVNAFRRTETQVVDFGVAPPYDTSNIFVHIQYLRRCEDFDQGCDVRGQCEEFDRQIPMTTNDYVLVDVSDTSKWGAPKQFGEGYIVAVAWRSAGGTPAGKIHHNHLFADEVTLDLVDGRAWGVGATTFRAVWPNTGSFPAADEADVNQVAWHVNRGDLEDFAILGAVGAGDAPGAGANGDFKYERLRYPQDHFLTVLSRQGNFSGIRPDDMQAIVVPISYIPRQDLNGNGQNNAEPFERQDRSVWNPEKLPAQGNYVNQYIFNVRVFDNDENLLSTGRRTVRCYARLTARELSGDLTDQAVFRGRPGIEAWQGWFHLESVGFATLPGLDNGKRFMYFNRAVVAQVDGLRRLPGKKSAWWGTWSVHDRTTCEIAPGSTAADHEPDWVDLCP